jgi:hypothetical protein
LKGNQPCQYFVILKIIGEKIEVIEMDNHHQKAKRPGMDETVKPYLKIIVAILAFMVVTAVPEKSISQIQNLSRVAPGVYSIKSDSFVLTLRALAVTGRVALGWPLLMVLVGWQLVLLPQLQDFSQAAGNGLIFAARRWSAGCLCTSFAVKRELPRCISNGRRACGEPCAAACSGLSSYW